MHRLPFLKATEKSGCWSLLGVSTSSRNEVFIDDYVALRDVVAEDRTLLILLQRIDQSDGVVYHFRTILSLLAIFMSGRKTAPYIAIAKVLKFPLGGSFWQQNGPVADKNRGVYLTSMNLET